MDLCDLYLSLGIPSQLAEESVVMQQTIYPTFHPEGTAIFALNSTGTTTMEPWGNVNLIRYTVASAITSYWLIDQILRTAYLVEIN